MNNLIMVTGGTAAQNSGLGINFGKIGFSEIVNKIVDNIYILIIGENSREG